MVGEKKSFCIFRTLYLDAASVIGFPRPWVRSLWSLWISGNSVSLLLVWIQFVAKTDVLLLSVFIQAFLSGYS